MEVSRRVVEVSRRAVEENSKVMKGVNIKGCEQENNGDEQESSESK